MIDCREPFNVNGEMLLAERLVVLARDLRKQREGLHVSSSRVPPVAPVLRVSHTFHERCYRTETGDR